MIENIQRAVDIDFKRRRNALSFRFGLTAQDIVEVFQNGHLLRDRISEIKEHAAKGGIFGVEKADWVAELEKQNPLKAAEMSLEDDYGMIDGIINNGPKEDKASEKGGKTSIMDRLKSAKTAQQTDKPSPHKEKKSEREL